MQLFLQKTTHGKHCLKAIIVKGYFTVWGKSLGYDKQYRYIIYDYDIVKILLLKIRYDARKAQRPTSSLYLHFNKNYTNYMSLYA